MPKKIDFYNKDKKIRVIRGKNTAEKKKIEKPVKPQKTEMQKELPKSKKHEILLSADNFKPELIKILIENQIQSAVCDLYIIRNNYLLESITKTALDDLTTEKYLSLGETIIFCNPCGIDDNPQYLNRLVSRFQCKNVEYLIVVSSYAFEGLTRKNNYEKIFKILEKGGATL